MMITGATHADMMNRDRPLSLFDVTVLLLLLLLLLFVEFDILSNSSISLGYVKNKMNALPLLNVVEKSHLPHIR